MQEAVPLPPAPIPGSVAVAKEIFVSAYVLYRTALPKFVWRVLPLLALAILVNPDMEKTGIAGSLLLSLLSIVIDSVAGGVALAVMLRVLDIEVTPNVHSFVALIATEIYLSLIIGLAALLLVFPAFWVAATTFVAPIYAFAYRQSPVSAVSSSASLTKGHLRPLLLVALFWLMFMVTGIGVAYVIPESFEFLGSLAYSLLWLYNYALVVVAFARLRPAG